MQSSAHGFCLCKRTHTLGGGGGNKRAGYRGAPCGGVPLVQAVPTIPVAVCVEARLVAVAIADPVRVAVSPASRRPLSAVVAVPKARGGIALRIADAVAELAPFAAARAKQRLALGRRQRRVKVGARTAVHDEREGCRLEPKHREVQGARGGKVAATEELVVAADREDVDAYLEGCALPGQGQRSGQPQGAPLLLRTPSCCALAGRFETVALTFSCMKVKLAPEGSGLVNETKMSGSPVCGTTTTLTK